MSAVATIHYTLLSFNFHACGFVLVGKKKIIIIIIIIIII